MNQSYGDLSLCDTRGDEWRRDETRMIILDSLVAYVPRFPWRRALVLAKLDGRGEMRSRARCDTQE
jgi:hypothetical protein